MDMTGIKVAYLLLAMDSVRQQGKDPFRDKTAVAWELRTMELDTRKRPDYVQALVLRQVASAVERAPSLASIIETSLNALRTALYEGQQDPHSNTGPTKGGELSPGSEHAMRRRLEEL